MSAFCIAPETQYARDPLLKREDVKILQEWLKKQPHLPRIEESQIIFFLHSCYYSIELTKQTIDIYFTRKTIYPEIFACLDENVLKKALSVGFKKIMPKKTPQGYTVFLNKLIDFKVDNYVLINEVVSTMMLTTLFLHQEGISEGFVTVIDMKGGALGHLTRINLSVLKQSMEHLQEGAPARIKGIHIINAVSFLDKIMGLLKPLMHGKLLDMIQVHSNLETLYKYVPKECLPEDYGGELPSCQKMHEENVKIIFENLDFFKWHDSQKVDETKRVGKSTISNPTFGVEGTFKKLELD